MATWVWIIVAVVIVAVLAVTAATARRRRTEALRQRFGPEYDRAVQSREDRWAAEAELREREKLRAGLDIRPLPEEQRLRFAGEWRALQERFVDQPAETVVAADRLVYQVMEARGYPMAEFAARADLISVDHPRVVQDYRFAHGVRERAEGGQAGTEELREAVVRYRALFTELLQDGREDSPVDSRPADSPDRAEAAAPADSPDRAEAAAPAGGSVPDGERYPDGERPAGTARYPDGERPADAARYPDGERNPEPEPPADSGQPPVAEPGAVAEPASGVADERR